MLMIFFALQSSFAAAFVPSATRVLSQRQSSCVLFEKAGSAMYGAGRVRPLLEAGGQRQSPRLNGLVMMSKDGNGDAEGTGVALESGPAQIARVELEGTQGDQVIVSKIAGARIAEIPVRTWARGLQLLRRGASVGGIRAVAQRPCGALTCSAFSVELGDELEPVAVDRSAARALLAARLAAA